MMEILSFNNSIDSEKMMNERIYYPMAKEVKGQGDLGIFVE